MLKMSFFKYFIISLIIASAKAQTELSEDVVTTTTTMSNSEADAEGTTEVIPSELNKDMTRNERSFFNDLWGDIFDDNDCCNGGQGNNYRNDYYGNGGHGIVPGGFKPGKAWKALKKPWFGLFDNGGCRGNCNNDQVHYHHGYNHDNNYNNNNAYNNNDNGNNYNPPKYEEPAIEYGKPKYEEPTQVYEEPAAPKYEDSAKHYENPKYEEPAYEKPSAVYKTPLYENAEKSYDCGSNNCAPPPQLVYQPIIYFGPPQSHVSEDSSEEVTKDEVETKCEEQSNNEEKSEDSDEKKDFEKNEAEKNDSCEEKHEYKKEHKVIPVAPVYVPCTQGCGAPSPYAYTPPSVPLHQVINYNSVIPNYAPIARHHDYHPYGYTQSHAAAAYYAAPPTPAPVPLPVPVSSGCGCAQQNYGPVYNHAVVPNHSVSHSFGSHSSQYVPHSQSHSNQYHGSHSQDHQSTNNHASHHYIHQAPVLTPHDQPYRACPELFAAYNEQLAHLTSINSLYK